MNKPLPHKKYHATLTFDRDQLLYDISNYCYVEGHIMPEDSEHSRHTTKDVAELGNIDRVTRLLDLYHAKAVEKLYRYTKHDLHAGETGTPWNNRLEEREQYQIDLILPSSYSQSTVNLLEHLVHEYLVCHVVADWLSITNTPKAEIWLAKASAAEDNINSAMHHLKHGVRRKLHPF